MMTICYLHSIEYIHVRSNQTFVVATVNKGMNQMHHLVSVQVKTLKRSIRGIFGSLSYWFLIIVTKTHDVYGDDLTIFLLKDRFLLRFFFFFFFFFVIRVSCSCASGIE